MKTRLIQCVFVSGLFFFFANRGWVARILAFNLKTDSFQNIPFLKVFQNVFFLFWFKGNKETRVESERVPATIAGALL